MFDDKNNIESDLLMRSILSQAEEEVPSHVWENISSELDRMAVKKTVKPVVVWFRRSAIAVAAAAAIAVGVVFNWDKDNTDIIQEAAGAGMSAVAEQQTLAEVQVVTPARTEEPVQTEVMILNETVVPTATPQEQIGPAAQAEPEGTVEDSFTSIQEQIAEKSTQKYIADAGSGFDDWADDFEEENTDRHIRNTSIVLSGLAGTNNARSNIGNGVIKHPSSSAIRPETGIRQTGTESSYGLPVTVGAGVKIGLAPRWSLGVGVNYTLLTRKFTGSYTKVETEDKITVIPSADIRNRQHYIGIPVTAFYDIIDRKFLNFYTYVGGAVERCVSNQYDILGNDIVHSEKVKGVQYSANFGVGLEFRLGEHLGLYFDPSLRYYFKNRQPKSIRTVQPLMMGLEFGLRVNL